MRQSQINGPGGCAISRLCPKHKVPLISTITEDTLCAVCERAEVMRLNKIIDRMDRKELHGCAGFNCPQCDKKD